MNPSGGSVAAGIESRNALAVRPALQLRQVEKSAPIWDTSEAALRSRRRRPNPNPKPNDLVSYGLEASLKLV